MATAEGKAKWESFIVDEGPFGAREVKILYVTENYLPMGRYYLKESKISDTAQPNMSSISSTGDS
ncbi:hypothetical protein PCANC_11350 [Puccinia coronata f. sp. avenae]|uniref:Uncharacterized protein n=1 Tax=Puccinia coronata f. sp. avenae TaxID=200324 RepID=A0A2N5VT51_9BASI|nr:hypothetical protein PCASD_06363 [Puccinia coronata f. sp. avenae]PLW53141.1 hypothetical protein PCANC_11350 [Puccinia coronata f. sp. avenae]